MELSRSGNGREEVNRLNVGKRILMRGHESLKMKPEADQEQLRKVIVIENVSEKKVVVF